MWRIDPTIDPNRVGLEEVKFIFAQAEKRLDDTIKEWESLNSRTISMITLMAGVLIGLSSYIISNWRGWPSANNKDLVAFIGSLYILGLFFYMSIDILEEKRFPLGSNPEDIMVPQFFDPTISTNRTPIFIYMSEIENYNLRIGHNLQMNARRKRRFRFSVMSILLLPVILGLIFILQQCIS